MICKNCGTSIPDNSKFCLKCGMSISSQQKTTKVNQVSKKTKFSQNSLNPAAVCKSKSNAVLIVLIVIVVILAVLAVNAYFTVLKTEKRGSIDKVKIGFICLHDENSVYDKNFILAAETVVKELGLKPDQYIIKTNIPEGNECYEAAADLADQGCDIVFANSFGHEPFMIKAAKEFPEVQFCHATGTMAHTEGVENYHNAFASIYEGKYLTGVAAGMKLNEMIESGKITAEEAKMGYVGAFTYAEVISGYTAFYLGAKSVCPDVTMEVQFTGSWYDEVLEKEAATMLISNGCVLISQSSESSGAPTVCENAGVPNISYTQINQDVFFETSLISSRINWAPYFKYIITAVLKGETIKTDWCGDLETGSVEISDINKTLAAEGTAEKLEEVKAKIISGDIKVFDTDTFTVNGRKLISYKADINTDPYYTADTEVISGGCFQESKFRSAPYFDIQIDGITLLNASF